MEYQPRYLRVTFFLGVFFFYCSSVYAQSVFSFKNGNKYYQQEVIEKIKSPRHIRNIAEINDRYVRIFFSATPQNTSEIQLMRKRLKTVISDCNKDSACVKNGFIHVWQERDKITYDIFKKYFPVVEFNLQDTRGKIKLLRGIEVQKMIVPKSMSTGKNNVSIKPRKAEGFEFIILSKDMQRNVHAFDSPILFSDGFCSLSLTMSSTHYSQIDVNTLPNKISYVIRVKFLCEELDGKAIEILSDVFLVEI